MVGVGDGLQRAAYFLHSKSWMVWPKSVLARGRQKGHAADCFHGLFNDVVLFWGKALSVEAGFVGCRILVFELDGEGKSFLFGDETFLFQQFTNNSQFVYGVNAYVAEIQKGLAIYRVTHMGRL